MTNRFCDRPRTSVGDGQFFTIDSISTTITNDLRVTWDSASSYQDVIQTLLAIEQAFEARLRHENLAQDGT